MRARVPGPCLDAHWALPPSRARPLPPTPWPSRPSSRKPPAPASTAPMPANGNTWSAAASPPSTATTTALTTCCWPAETSPAKFYRNASTRGGALKFEAETSGLELDKVTGAYPLDVDSDGVTDLVLLRVGENVVMRGTGRLPFRARQRTLGLRRRRCLVDGACRNLGTRRRLADDRDRQLHRPPRGDFAMGVLHRQLAAQAGAWPSAGFAAPVALKPSFCALSMLFTDWNQSGTPSLRVSNDREYYEGGQEQLWHVDPGQAPALYTDKEGWKVLRIWGMGIASYDLDADGYPEYFLTSMADNKLQTLAAVSARTASRRRHSSDVAFAKGVTAHRPYTGGDWHPSTAWHAQFEDVNNDGLVDLFIAKGNVAKMPDFAMKDPNNLLLQGSDGKFKEAGEAAGIASFANHRGAALTDFNLDGLLDLVVVNRWENAQVWRNTSQNAGRWIEVKLQQAGPEPRRDRRLARDTMRGSDGHAPRDHRRRRPCQRPVGLAALRAGRSAQSRAARGLAGRQQRRLAGRRQPTISTFWSVASRCSRGRRSRRRRPRPCIAAPSNECAWPRIAAHGQARRRRLNVAAPSHATSFPTPKTAALIPGAKICSSRNASARTAQPSRMSGISLGSVSNEMALLCWPPAVLAIASRIGGSSRSKASAPWPTIATGAGSISANRLPSAKTERLAGLAERLALRPVVAPRLVGKCCDVGIADVGDGRRILGHAVSVAPDRVVAGIGLDAAAAAAAAQRSVRAVDHMAEFAAGRLRAGEQFAAQHHAHADAVRQQDRDEIVPVAFRIVRTQRHRDHVAVVLDGHRNAGRVLEHCRERNVGVRRDRRPQHHARCRNR